MALTVDYSAHAATQLGEMRARAEAKPQSAHGAAWEGMKRVLNEIVANEDHALGATTSLRGDLSKIRRAKMGRTRVFFIASREKQRAIVLMLGFRKEGDKNDAYAEVTKRLRRGEFALLFLELGIE